MFPARPPARSRRAGGGYARGSRPGRPATISNRNSRHSIAPLNSGVRREGLRPISFGEPQVAGEQARGPAGEVLLQRVAELRVERRERGLVVQPHAVGRVGDQDAGGRGRRPRQHVGRVDVDPAGDAGRRGVARGTAPTARGSTSLAKIERPSRRGAHAVARALADALPRRAVEPRELLEAEACGASPGARSAAISAASIGIVPLPHIGSSSGVPGVQPESASTPAARFSRSGAASASRRQPRLNSGSPEVSR